ncbi:hypothetical protein [Streptomyces sp. NPDC059828]|uniref:hypothetical protein n=1 Tax=Streptomyces sp. NPDC059828 TaxID=3346965 RepID=UPI0036619476
MSCSAGSANTLVPGPPSQANWLTGASRADDCARHTAGEPALVLYGRTPIDSLRLLGDRRLFDQLQAWEPE